MRKHCVLQILKSLRVSLQRKNKLFFVTILILHFYVQ